MNHTSFVWTDRHTQEQPSHHLPQLQFLRSSAWTWQLRQGWICPFWVQYAGTVWSWNLCQEYHRLLYRSKSTNRPRSSVNSMKSIPYLHPLSRNEKGRSSNHFVRKSRVLLKESVTNPKHSRVDLKNSSDLKQIYIKFSFQSQGIPTAK